MREMKFWDGFPSKGVKAKNLDHVTTEPDKLIGGMVG